MKKVAILVKDNKVSEYPADLLIDGKIIKSKNLEFECSIHNIELVIGKGLSSRLIKKLRDKGITFLKVNSLDEIEGLNLDIILPIEFKNKRGWKCGKKGF